MRSVWRGLVCVLLALSPATALNNHGVPDVTQEQQAWFGDASAGYVVSGCAPAVPGSGLTLAAFACKGYGKETGVLHYIDQPAFAVTVTSAATSWLAIHRNTTSTPTGCAGGNWVRVAGSHYLTCASATHPQNPTGGLLFRKIIVTAGNVSSSFDYRYLSPQGSAARSLNVTDAVFGADPTGATDSTAAFQAAANASADRPIFFSPIVGSAATGTNAEIIIPAGHYKVNNVVTFTGSYLTIKSDGKAIIEQTDVTKNIFEISAAYMVHIEGLQFVGGNTHILIYNANLDSAVWKIEKCNFYNSASWAIDTQPPSGANPLSTQSIIKDSRFLANGKVLRNWNDHAQIQNSWIFLRAGQTLSNTAAIENRGFLHMFGMFGVPADKAVGPLTNVRWIDNYNSLMIQHSRFGGEFGGNTPVWNYAHVEIPLPANGTGPRIIIENSEVWDNTASQGIVTIKAAVDTHPGVPALVLLRGNLGPDGQPILANPDALDLTTYVNAVTSPEARFRFEMEPNSQRGALGIPAALKRFVTYHEDTWTPVLTFATPGNLSVAYTTQQGTYTKTGNAVTVRGQITTSTFTHTTASGTLLITGLPFASQTTPAAAITVGSVSWAGITKAGFTDIVPEIVNNSSQIVFVASQSGAAASNVVAADVPTAGTVALVFTVSYQIW